MIYVTDVKRHQVIVMDTEWNFKAIIGKGELHNPTAITVHNGYVYVTSDSSNDMEAAVMVNIIKQSST